MADAPGFFDKLGGMLDPGGDVDGIRRAAAACRKLSTDLDARVQSLDPAVKGVHEFWHGRASEGFQATWKKFVPALAEYNEQLTAAGGALDKIADEIHEAQVKADHLKIAMAATAVLGVVFTVFTAGGSDAVAAAAIQAEAGAFAIWVAETVGAEIVTIEALLSAIEATAARFALGAGASALAVGGVKALHGQNLLDPANWSADDITHVLFDGVLTAGVGVLADTTAVGAALETHPYAGAAAAGAFRSGMASALGQFWLNGYSVTDLDAWETVGLSAGVAGVSGIGVARAFNGSAGDLSRGLTGIPSGTVNYALNFPQIGAPLGADPQSPIAELPAVPSIPRPVPRPGVSHTVRPGDSLWAIAGKEYGDPAKFPLIAEANGIAPPYVVEPGQRLRIPPIH